jgi:hypothetical protein
MDNLMRQDFVTASPGKLFQNFMLEGFTIHYNPFHGRIR